MYCNSNLVLQSFPLYVTYDLMFYKTVWLCVHRPSSDSELPTPPLTPLDQVGYACDYQRGIVKVIGRGRAIRFAPPTECGMYMYQLCMWFTIVSVQGWGESKILSTCIHVSSHTLAAGAWTSLSAWTCSALHGCCQKSNFDLCHY